jgi:hypothetical protein
MTLELKRSLERARKYLEIINQLIRYPSTFEIKEKHNEWLIANSEKMHSEITKIGYGNKSFSTDLMFQTASRVLYKNDWKTIDNPIKDLPKILKLYYVYSSATRINDIIIYIKEELLKVIQFYEEELIKIEENEVDRRENQYISKDLINSLRSDQITKNHISDMLEVFSGGNDKDTCHRIGLIGEAIAKELIKKIKTIKQKTHTITVKWKDFRSALNTLTNQDLSGKKYNYKFLGHFLFPLLYIRNEKDHPDPQIEFDKDLAVFALNNLSIILKYLAKQKVSFNIRI